MVFFLTTTFYYYSDFLKRPQMYELFLLYILKDADEPAPSENIMEKLEIQITSPKPPPDDVDKVTLKSSQLDDKDVASEKESKKEGKEKRGGQQDKKKSPRKSTAKSGGSKTHSKASIKTGSDDKKQDDDLATVDQVCWNVELHTLN